MHLRRLPYDAGSSEPTKAVSDSIEAAYQQLASSLGLAVRDLQVGVLTSIDTAGDALTQLQVAALQDGQEIYNRRDRLGGIENVGRSQEDLEAAINAEMQQVLLAALRHSDLPAKFKDYLGAATDVTAAVSTVVAVRQLDEAFRRIGGPLAQLTQLSVEAEVAYINQLGGVQALSTALDGYYQNFFSEAERQATTTQRLTEEFGNLGLQMPATRDGLRAIIQAQDLSTESGRRTYAGLLNLSGAFAEVVPAAAAAEEAVQTIVDTAADIARQRQDLLQQEQQPAGEYHGLCGEGYLEWLAANHAKKEGETIPGVVVEASERYRDTFKPGEWVRVWCVLPQHAVMHAIHFATYSLVAVVRIPRVH